MRKPSARLRFKTRVLTAVVVAANVLGNVFLSLGLKNRIVHVSPAAFLEVLFNPWITLGVALLILWLLSRMALLSWADLSYVLPVTSIGYVLTVVFGRVFLFEDVSWWRWLGVLLITAGVALVGATPLRTVRRRMRQGGSR
ncbi:MAG: hypothetical protein RMK57_01550 [Bryobacterales bacterium]|nr:hypothetical protein [Bryobacteraceae bacterium]MDW8353189.1 hypothetical protein [Bryobacterales bacterium]